MRYNLVLNIIGLIARYIGMLFLIPIVAAILLKEYSQITPFLITGVLSYLTGVLLLLNKVPQKSIDNIKKSESLAVVFFLWVFFALICTVPYLFYGFNFCDACFESVSGITTTGSTIFTNFDIYPRTLFFYRTLTQWLGGMGIVVLFIAVLPKIAVAGRQMFYAEAPAPTEDKATPRIRYTASWLWGLYLTFTIVETIILKLLGLNLYDAVVTSLSTMATGGLLHLPQSIQGFDNNYVSVCVLIFMFIAATNYILIYRSIRNKKITPFFKNEEFKTYLAIVVTLSLLLAFSLFINSHQPFLKALLNSTFEILATMTSTGFAIDDYVNWDITSKLILFISFFTGGCAMSSSGGIKIIRLIFIWKYLKRELNKIIHPQGVYPIKLEGAAINNDVTSQMIAFVVFYFAAFALGAFLIALIEQNTTIALSSSVTAIGNVGPGYGIIGPMGNFEGLHTTTKWILILLMLVGRLEIIPFLAILNKDLWKN